jgi:hypothetical protein
MSLLRTGDTHMTKAQRLRDLDGGQVANNTVQPTSYEATERKAPSKQECLAALLQRDEGATLDQMIATTGWLPHTTRAAMTGLRKKGYSIDSDKVDGVRTYRAVAPR